MKKIAIIILLGLFLYGCKTEPEQETAMPMSEVMKYIEEVAGMVDYYDHLRSEYPNLVRGPNEIQGQCGDYALLFALKTGAKIVVVNTNPRIENGIYKVAGKSNDSSIINSIEKSFTLKDKNGDLQSGYWYTDYDLYLYHPKIGLYRLNKVNNYTPKINYNHVWNLLNTVELGTIEIDVSNYDVNGTWQP